MEWKQPPGSYEAMEQAQAAAVASIGETAALIAGALVITALVATWLTRRGS